MLVRFVVANFLSYRDETEFNMIAEKLKQHANHVKKIGKTGLLRTSVLYGANGSGKSNLIKAISIFQEIVKDGKLKKTVENFKFKLDNTFIDKPIHLEMEITVSQKFYSYGLKISGKTILEEWLYESGGEAGKMLFERTAGSDGKVDIKVAPKFEKNSKERLLIQLMQENLVKEDELFIGKADYLNIEQLTEVRNWIMKKMVVIFPTTVYKDIAASLLFESSNKIFSETLCSLDTGIKGLKLKRIEYEQFEKKDQEFFEKELASQLTDDKIVILESYRGSKFASKENGQPVIYEVVTAHEDKNGNEVLFDLKDESDGTRRLLDLIPMINLLKKEDITFIVDEMDRSLHPSLQYEFISKISKEKDLAGQLIFSTHESNLLDMDIFRQDEIWFAEKDKQTGSTKLYSLNEFKPRYDLDIRKGYLMGRFGAIPFLADLKELNWSTNGIQETGL
ncbi:MAG: ATP-binding protein [Ignavibacteriales bacterium]|nr:ATP-binding protein [Ignavibacteriales bacterium]